jgi:hypothetical protein
MLVGYPSQPQPLNQAIQKILMCLKILKIQVNQVNRNLAAPNGDVINKDKSTITTILVGEVITVITAIILIVLTVAMDLMYFPTIVEAIAIVKIPARRLSVPI